MKKIKKPICTDFPFRTLLGPKTSKQNFSQKIIAINFNFLCFYATVSSSKKSDKFCALLFGLEKTHFSLISDTPLANTISKQAISPKN